MSPPLPLLGSTWNGNWNLGLLLFFSHPPTHFTFRLLQYSSPQRSTSCYPLPLLPNLHCICSNTLSLPCIQIQTKFRFCSSPVQLPATPTHFTPTLRQPLPTSSLPRLQLQLSLFPANRLPADLPSRTIDLDVDAHPFGPLRPQHSDFGRNFQPASIDFTIV